MAIAVSQKHALNNPIISSRKIHCFEDTNHLMTYPIAIFLQRNYPLQLVFSHHIRWIIESGLINKWSSDSKPKYEKPTKQHFGPTVLSLEHVFIGFAFFLIFTLFSCGAFIAETIVYRMMRRRKVSHFWRFAEVLIDGKRHFWIPISVRHSKI